MKYTIYTDGAYRRSVDRGGWGWYCQSEVEYHGYGGENKTTNNRMEIQAVLEALKATQPKDTVTIVSDSQYVVNTLNLWLRSWHKSKRLYGNKLKNTDQWIIILKLIEERYVTARWVKGHNGDYGNEMADQLANKGIDRGHS